MGFGNAEIQLLGGDALAIFGPKVPRVAKKYRYTETLEIYRESPKSTATLEIRSEAPKSIIGGMLYCYTVTLEIRSDSPKSIILLLRGASNT